MPLSLGWPNLMSWVRGLGVGVGFGVGSLGWSPFNCRLRERAMTGAQQGKYYSFTRIEQEHMTTSFHNLIKYNILGLSKIYRKGLLLN